MKKTINISLGKVSFQIEEDAYQRLDKYLTDIKSHFSVYQNPTEAEEIVNDIENRMAEHFLEKLNGSTIIQLPLVEELIKVIGNPDQLSGEEKTDAPKTNREFKALGKKLYRNPDDAIIAGVCSGLAAFIGNVDPVWVRLIFAVSILAGGFGVLIYIILWIIVPAAKSDPEKIQMRGEPVNLKNLEDIVKERVDEFKQRDNSKVKKIISAPFLAIGAIIQALVKFGGRLFTIIIKIIGVFISFGSIILLVGLMILGVGMIINTGSPYFDFPFKEIAIGWPYYTGVISGFFILFVPLMFLTLLGTSLVGGKSNFGKMNTIGLISIWIIACVFFANIALRLAPQVESAYKNQGLSEMTSQVIDLKDFKIIAISSNYEAVIKLEDEYKIIALGASKDLNETRIQLEADTLVVNRQDDFTVCIFCIKKPVRLEIYTPDIAMIKASGASDVYLEGFTTDEIQLELSGASKAKFNLAAKKMITEISGASHLFIENAIDEIQAEISGASSLSANNAIVQKAQVNLNGASKAYFGDLNYLKTEINGASKVFYTSVVELITETSGAGQVIQQ